MRVKEKAKTVFCSEENMQKVKERNIVLYQRVKAYEKETDEFLDWRAKEGRTMVAISIFMLMLIWILRGTIASSLFCALGSGFLFMYMRRFNKSFLQKVEKHCQEEISLCKEMEKEVERWGEER